MVATQTHDPNHLLKAISREDSEFSLLGGTRVPPLVIESLSQINESYIPSNSPFLLKEVNGKYFVTENTLINKVSSSVVFGSAPRFKTIKIRETIKGEPFREEIVSGTFEQKIKYAASLKDKRANQLGMLIEAKTRFEGLKLEAYNLGDKKAYELHSFHVKNLDYSISSLQKCGTSLIQKKDLKVISDGKRRFFNGLMRCNSIFCAYCSGVKMFKRSLDISKKLEGVFKMGKQVVFITLNQRFKHSFYNVKELQETLFANFKDLIDSRFFRSVNKGIIRSTEITYSNKGFNYHHHVLLVVEANVSLVKLKEQVQNKWENNIKEKYKRTADFSRQNDWFIPVRNTKKDIEKVSSYFSSSVSDYSIADEVSSNRKNPLWASLPPEAFANVFRHSKRVRFFSSTKLLKISSSDKQELVEQVLEDKGSSEVKETVLVTVPREDYLKLDLGTRIVIRAVVKDRALSDKDCICRINLILSRYRENFALNFNFDFDDQHLVDTC